jgi:eukaryotic-like serine/threonine-protein kinase
MGVSARTPDPCLDESELLAYADARGVVGRQRSDVEAHVASCAECRTLLSALAQSASVVQVKSGVAFAATEFGGNATMRLPSEPPGRSPSVAPASGGPVNPSRRSGGARLAVESGAPASLVRATTPELAVRVGEVLAQKYRIDRVLGVGGMGVVVAAHHLALGQSFAIKFLHPQIAREGEAKARFLREARAAAQLRGEHVVRVTDTGALESGTGTSVPYLVMELLDGQSLGTLLRAGRRFDPDESVLYMLQAAEALAEAHRQGMVHRDLKPDNLFLARRADGTPFVKVVDFGISKTREEGALSLTSHNAIMGTPRYMAPEQMRSSKDVDARADVWALGAILYELLAGAPPFDAASITELITQVQLAPHVPLASRVPGLAPDLAAVVEGCLQKDPASRIPDTLALARALRTASPRDGWVHIERIERLLGTASLPPPAPAPAPAPVSRVSHAPAAGGVRLWHVALGALSLGALLGGVGLVALTGHDGAATSVRTEPLGLAGVAPSAPTGTAALDVPVSLVDAPSASSSIGAAHGPAVASTVVAKGNRGKPAPSVPVASAPVAAPSPAAPSSAPPVDPHGLRSRN